MLTEFLQSNFNKAIEMQLEIKHDPPIVKAIQKGAVTRETVKSWMRKYGLLRGISAQEQDKVADAFIDFSNHNRNFSERDIAEVFRRLHQKLKSASERSWLSATSKLMWCMQPDIIVIYDRFVFQSILVLQCLDKELATYPRIGQPIAGRRDQDSVQTTAFYMNYQDMVKAIYRRNRQLIQDLKNNQSSRYDYDLRLLDKILWMMGNANETFTLGTVECERL